MNRSFPHTHLYAAHTAPNVDEPSSVAGNLSGGRIRRAAYDAVAYAGMRYVRSGSDGMVVIQARVKTATRWSRGRIFLSVCDVKTGSGSLLSSL